jgi:hypothetical protein
VPHVGRPDPQRPQDTARAEGDQRGSKGNFQQQRRHLLAHSPLAGECLEAAQFLFTQGFRLDHAADEFFHGPLAEAIDDLSYGSGC